MKRPFFVQAVAASGTFVLMASQGQPARALPENGSAYPGLLDGLREKIHRWTESLWDPVKGGFRQNAKIGVNLMSTTDVAWMRYAVNGPVLEGGHREPWVRWLQRVQDPETGIVRYDPRDGGQIRQVPAAGCHPGRRRVPRQPVSQTIIARERSRLAAIR